MLVLGIDPGVHCGFAILGDGMNAEAWGQWELKGKKPEGYGARYVRLRNMLTGMLAAYPEIKVVGYEDVKRHLGVLAAHSYGGIIALITEFCETKKLKYVGIPVGTIKKRATGSGNSDKPAMIAAALKQWPSLSKISDNTADAFWVAVCTMELK